ncbi:Rrf2 family transcriptional regulator [Clostridium celatum]|uniref:Putative HTH-type transcriptional regulator IscR n=1 Tax=Clostridium celatum DSM 1785 TaxID=545697 RepID=L1QAX9_9CLOT|nr:Rrf2 family transcriptional regulator [Clostridium celatum]EKY25106.1 putative HTH-type transcriptional regulator IscR [Clostridium celatum DSM 1785]MCE9655934.1 Rrf2 family transcriptional regulator [Clostridium celatum]MDU3723044.1 Rrf2 family transcriptional regulator [Clostridium celatum]MDU6294863.1 Rrf2 family transcriptional regulator [Clostridium celatum]MDY3361071.1 Rrf2 family transcriptional regulator [Clostridium celatum]
MKISTKGRYGLRALIDLVINSENESVTLKAISERQEISERYLEQIFSLLRKASIIIGRKGAQGGYTLAKSTQEITIGEILRALEGESFLIDINDEKCNDIESFINNNLWSEINTKINNYFNSITLKEFVEKYKSEKEEIIYYI